MTTIILNKTPKKYLIIKLNSNNNKLLNHIIILLYKNFPIIQVKINNNNLLIKNKLIPTALVKLNIKMEAFLKYRLWHIII